MGSSNHRTDSTRPSRKIVALAKSLAPEDLRVGQYVSVLRVTYEVPSYIWCCCHTFGDPSELVRLSLLPDEAAEPFKVKSVCLPFVLVRTASGLERALDVRRVQLARLDDRYARAAWKAAKPKRRKRTGGKRKKR